MTYTEQYNQYVKECIKERPAFGGPYEDYYLEFDEWIYNHIADDFAIEFANYINRVSYRSFDGNWYLTQEDEDIKKTTKELLELFKK